MTIEYGELTRALVEADHGPPPTERTDAAIDRVRRLKIALYGSAATALEWRERLTSADMGDRPIDWFDPRTVYRPGDPSHFIVERYHLHDDIRVSVVTDDSYSLISLLEIAHMLETKMEHPLVVCVAPYMREDAGDDETKIAVSNRLRRQIIDMLMKAQADERRHNLYIATDLEQVVEIVNTLVLQLQAGTP